MKEATGEANMTIITVVLIGIVSIIGIPLIRGLLTSTSSASECQARGGSWEGGKCVEQTADNYQYGNNSGTGTGTGTQNPS